MTFGSTSSTSNWRNLQDIIFDTPKAFFLNGHDHKNSAFNEKYFASSKTLMTKDLPNRLQLLTYERVQKNKILLRIGHQYGIHEDAKLSQPISIDLAEYFSEAKEVTKKHIFFEGLHIDQFYNKVLG